MAPVIESGVERRVSSSGKGSTTPFSFFSVTCVKASTLASLTLLLFVTPAGKIIE